MIISRDRTGITIKDHADTTNHIRIGVTRIRFMVDGVERACRSIDKPHDDFTINDCHVMLDQLQAYEAVNDFATRLINLGR